MPLILKQQGSHPSLIAVDRHGGGGNLWRDSQPQRME
jgi:hypothetical protein